jgi:hypothetical protein
MPSTGSTPRAGDELAAEHHLDGQGLDELGGDGAEHHLDGLAAEDDLDELGATTGGAPPRRPGGAPGDAPDRLALDAAAGERHRLDELAAEVALEHALDGLDAPGRG